MLVEDVLSNLTIPSVYFRAISRQGQHNLLNLWNLYFPNEQLLDLVQKNKGIENCK